MVEGDGRHQAMRLAYRDAERDGRAACIAVVISFPKSAADIHKCSDQDMGEEIGERARRR